MDYEKLKSELINKYSIISNISIDDNVCCIYCIINMINNKIYIGKSVNFKSRMNEHKRLKDDTYIHNAIQKYGFKNFHCFVLSYYDSEEDAFECEKKFISHLRENNYELYNLSNGGEGNSGWKHTQEAIEKIRSASLGNTYSLDFKHSDETKRKQSEYRMGNQFRKGIPHTEATKKQISESLTGSKNPFYGKKHSEEFKKTMMGTNNPNSSLKEEDVKEIKKLLENKQSVMSLAKQYNVGLNTIYRIKNGKTYVNIK